MLANATFARKKTAHSKQPNLEKREANQHQQVNKQDPRPLKVPRPAELKIKATGTARQVTLWTRVSLDRHVPCLHAPEPGNRKSHPLHGEDGKRD